MTSVDFAPLSVAVPLWEDPPGVFRVGNSRVLLELVLRAYLRGESPEGIVRSYRSLRLADVYTVIGRYLQDPARFDEYLRLCDEQADAVRRKIEAEQGPGISKAELTLRAKGLPGPPPAWKPESTETAAGMVAACWTEEDDRILEQIHAERKRGD